MEFITLDNKVLEVITFLARTMKTSREDIIRRAISNLLQDIEQRKTLMEIAGMAD